MGISSDNEDGVLWRLRRSLMAARTASVRNQNDYRRALILTAEIRDQIHLLTKRLGLIEGEMRSVVHRANAMNAYRSAVNRAGSYARGRGKGAN